MAEERGAFEEVEDPDAPAIEFAQKPQFARRFPIAERLEPEELEALFVFRSQLPERGTFTIN